VKVVGRWTYPHRAVDQFGQVIDVLAAEKRELAAARRFFTRALPHGRRPVEVTTDRAASYPRVLNEQLPAAPHVNDQYANKPTEADHGRFTARLRPMRGHPSFAAEGSPGNPKADCRHVLTPRPGPDAPSRPWRPVRPGWSAGMMSA